MTKHIVSYTLPYTHRVQVGIEAATPQQAIDKASALFDTGDLWDDTAEYPLLFDDFEEDADAGVPLEFHVDQSLPDTATYPDPDASVRVLRANINARIAARLLAEAYQNAEANDASVAWEDINEAYEYALDSQC